MNQLSFDEVTVTDDFDPRVGLERSEWKICADWCIAHPEATRWICRETGRINREESRAASFRQDIEPYLAAHSREYGLDIGIYNGVDHRLSAPLSRYLMATRRGLRFRLRARAGDHVKNATPEAAL